ncbi:MAG: nitroreductase family protein [Anaerolineaceae bacterium]
MIDKIDFILKRRSIRRFEDRPVEVEKITLLLKAGMAAPSAVNSQPWEFVIISEEPLLKQLRAALEYGKMQAPLIIAVLGSPKVASSFAGETYWVQDCSAAVENILIAAANLDLGAVWVGVYPRPRKMEAVRKILDIPNDVLPLCLLHIGYPAEDKPPHTKYKEDRIHWQQYKSDKSYILKPFYKLVDKVIKMV